MTCNGEFRYIGIGQEGKNLAAAPTNVRLYAKSTSSLTFAWDDTNAARTYTVQCADAPSEDAELMAQYTYTWTTKSTSDKWPYDYPTRMTFLGLMKGGDRSVGSEENLIRPGKTYYFRVRGGGANDEAKWIGVDFGDAEARALHLRARSSTKGSTGRVGAATGSIRLRAPHEERQYADEYLETAMGYGRESCRDDLRQLLHGGQFQRRSLQSGSAIPAFGIGAPARATYSPVRATRSAATAANVGAFRILALGAEKLSAEGDAVTLTFKATPWSRGNYRVRGTRWTTSW